MKEDTCIFAVCRMSYESHSSGQELVVDNTMGTQVNYKSLLY